VIEGVFDGALLVVGLGVSEGDGVGAIDGPRDGCNDGVAVGVDEG